MAGRGAEDDQFMKSPQLIESTERQIREIQRGVDYQVREYPIEVVVKKHVEGREEGRNELFVPDYQRDFVWDDKQQSKFIESLLMGLPSPYIFVVDVGSEDEGVAGRLEILDGTQRIRTLARFIAGDLELCGLEKLTSLNGFKYTDLAPSRQRRFGRITLRMIELTEQAKEEFRRDMFERINAGGGPRNPMEVRRSSFPGPFMDLIDELSKDVRFEKLAPISWPSRRRLEREELTCRFFTFFDRYEAYEGGKLISEFIDAYVRDMNETIRSEGPASSTVARLSDAWTRTMTFVERHFPVGFAKTVGAKSTPRVRFEAIAVGSARALQENPHVAPTADEIRSWLDGPEFNRLTTSDAANN
jgi:hypothetical protein